MDDPNDTVEFVARESYGRLLAWLVSRCGDICEAEDALGDALVAALSAWPAQGVPRNPEAWLLTVARRRLIDRHRRDATRQDSESSLRYHAQLQLHREAAEASQVPFRDGLPDRRLELLFMCAHPDIPEAMRTPLMLQSVLGLTAIQIASLMLLPPSTVAKRLVRLKRAIAGAIPFAIPEPDELPRRLQHVLDAVYAAYGAGWDTATDLGTARFGLAGEAFWLAGLLVRLAPESAECLGLYALFCFCESRRSARRTSEGEYVPLEEQDCGQWDSALIAEGEKALALAASKNDTGPYQIEAAVHSVHSHRAKANDTDWRAIHFTYEVLVRRFPSAGARIAFAASHGRTGRPAVGLDILDDLDATAMARHQPYWAVRAWLLAQADRSHDAVGAYDRAIGLCDDPSVRAWLVEQRRRLTGRD